MIRPASLRRTYGPSVAVQLASHQVSAASLDRRFGKLVVTAHATEPLPEGALVPSLTAENVHNRAAVVAALGQVLERTGRPKRIGLIVPDPVTKVSLVKFEQVPDRPQDLEQLIRWQARKTAPFPIQEAQVSFIRALGAEDGQEFLVSFARRTVVEEYEGLCAEAGVHAGIVDIATFNLINAVLAAPKAPEGDWLLVNVAPDYATIAIVRGENPIFFRNRAADTDGTLADLVHQTTMYYEDRLSGAGFSHVFVTGTANAGSRHEADVRQIRQTLQERLATRIDVVDPRAAAALTDRIAAGPAVLETLAPLVGLLLRSREVGVH